jgi:hypothetical protein
MKPSFSYQLRSARFAFAMAVIALMLGTAAFAIGEPVAGNGPPATPMSGVLLLRNGGVIQGEISLAGDRWFVRSAGRETQVPAANVDIFGPSISALYELQRQRITQPTAESHLMLADWCLRNAMLAEAERELASARNLDPRHPRVSLLDQRLAVAKAPRIAMPVTKHASSPSKIGDTPATTRNTDPTLAVPSPQISDAAVERFTRRVQPLLLNNCTTSGCHQAGSSQSFQLDRALLHGLSNRRSTMSNLTVTLALVNRDQPLMSPLLTVPRAPHGGMSEPVFSPANRKNVEQLLEWVMLVTEAPTAAEDTAPTNGKTAESRRENAVQPANYDETARANADIARANAASSVANSRAWRPKDPFDPEIFNRRFHQAQNAEQ